MLLEAGAVSSRDLRKADIDLRDGLCLLNDRFRLGQDHGDLRFAMPFVRQFYKLAGLKGWPLILLNPRLDGDVLHFSVRRCSVSCGQVLVHELRTAERVLVDYFVRERARSCNADVAYYEGYSLTFRRDCCPSCGEPL